MDFFKLKYKVKQNIEFKKLPKILLRIKFFYSSFQTKVYLCRVKNVSKNKFLKTNEILHNKEKLFLCYNFSLFSAV